MPRGPRLDSEGALHHVIARGIERSRIFRDDRDRCWCRDRLGRVVIEGGADLHAWCFMPNHIHLLVRTGATSLSRLMQRWLGAYAVTFNLRHRRAGHLFQNRFKSILVDEQAYLLELVRYIHLNPVRGRRPEISLAALDDYPWTGHAALLGTIPFSAQRTDFVLRQFGVRVGAARRAYRDFVRAGHGDFTIPDLEGGGLRRSAGGWRPVRTLTRGREQWAHDERVLGDGVFVERVIHQALDARVVPVADPAELMATLCERLASPRGVTAEQVARPSRCVAALDARALVCEAAVRDHHLALTIVGRHFGVSKQSIGRALVRAARLKQA
jgi:REP element-mobilizing transposase RayT